MERQFYTIKRTGSIIELVEFGKNNRGKFRSLNKDLEPVKLVEYITGKKTDLTFWHNMQDVEKVKGDNMERVYKCDYCCTTSNDAEYMTKHEKECCFNPERSMEI